MTATTPTTNQPLRIPQQAINSLIHILEQSGFRVIGPTIDQHAITYNDIHSLNDLPQNWTDTQAPGLYQLSALPNSSPPKLFQYNLGPHSWKKFLFPPESDLPSLNRPQPPPEKPLAILGARACELAAIAIQDRVFMGEQFQDSQYALRRKDLFVIAVQCTTAAETCFCTSMNTGPQLPPTYNSAPSCSDPNSKTPTQPTSYDLAITELGDSYLLRIGSPQGQRIANQLQLAHPFEPSTPAELEEEHRTIDEVRRSIRKSLPTENLRENLLARLQHPHWDDVAARCLSCANCTMVCPTCFCSSVDDVHDLTDETIYRKRRWDSCFNPDFSHTSGAAVRDSIRSRYRQWLTHKLATWFDQFDTSGCVGCGRCITWCPVGIDLTAEVAKLIESPLELSSAPVSRQA